MSRFVKILTVAFLTLALLIAGLRAGAQHSPKELFLSNGSPLLHLSGDIANGKLTISWPLRYITTNSSDHTTSTIIITGNWELRMQQPAYTGEWTPIAPNLYHTNGSIVSVTTSLPDKPALYRLRRALPLRPPGFPTLPPMPPAPTNRPARPNLPGHP